MAPDSRHKEGGNNWRSNWEISVSTDWDGWILLIFNGFNWKLGFWCIPNSVFCVVQPCRKLFSEKHDDWKLFVQWCSNDFSSAWTTRWAPTDQPHLEMRAQNVQLGRPGKQKTTPHAWANFLTLLKIGVLVHPQLGLLCGAALPVAFFSEKTTFEQTHKLWFWNHFS